jgi:hypothetical protein
MAAGDRGRRCGLNYKPSFRPSEARAGTQGHALVCFYVGGRCRDRAVLDSNWCLTQDRQHLVSVETANAFLFQHFRDAQIDLRDAKGTCVQV